ncbi:CS1 type fimbrial major subunit [Burkholderia diffusa]|uniref:CS1 type fimbrial major subunit n=1 Tax=Burkholderia diffusa TaxID=488732 RepID=UPI00075C68D2|nr:CS1 type fimbrial major subunit [Burkholderia diffusa]KVH48397.1 hypothetical protein WJ39_13875 [Burkholderia diffusa]
MFNKTIVALALAAASGAAFAETQNFDVAVRASVPTEDFHVTPVSWDVSEVQLMNFDALAGKLTPMNRQLHMKSTIGAITGQLVFPPTLSSGTNTIALDVTVNGKKLAVDSANEVVTETDAAAGKHTLMVVEAPGTTRPDAGNYSGTIQMVFESVTP